MSQSEELAEISDLNSSDLVGWGRLAIFKASSVDEVRKVLDTVDALAAYQKSTDAAEDLIIAAAWVCCYCQRRLGELILADLAGFGIAGNGHAETVPGGTTCKPLVNRNAKPSQIVRVAVADALGRVTPSWPPNCGTSTGTSGPTGSRICASNACRP